MTPRANGHVSVATLLGVLTLLGAMAGHAIMTAERLAVLETKIVQCSSGK